MADEVQQSALRNPVVNAASSARPMPAGASTLGNSQLGHLGNTQRGLPINQQPMQGQLPGNVMSSLTQMQPSSPSQLAANRMPPPSNPPSRQLMTSHMGQQGGVGVGVATSKSLQIDSATASQLAVQQQHHHQLQQQQQMQRQPQQQQQQQQQQLAATSQLAAQLTGQV